LAETQLRQTNALFVNQCRQFDQSTQANWQIAFVRLGLRRHDSFATATLCRDLCYTPFDKVSSVSREFPNE